MKKLLKYPFLCLLVLTMLVTGPYVWQELGIIPQVLPAIELPQLKAQTPLPEVQEPAPSQTVITEPEDLPEVPQEDFPPPEEPVIAPTPLPQPSETKQPGAESNPEAESEPKPGPIRDQPPEDNDPNELIPPKPENPFEGALFIGDSRTVGIGKYAGITESDFFATTGMSVYNIFKQEVKVGSRDAKCTLETLLSEQQYDRIFLMLGINELGFNLDNTATTYGEVVSRLRELQPDAYIHIQANLHVTKKKSDTDKTYNNDRINRLNESISAFADGKKVFYLDINPIYDDENGAMPASYTWDEIHLYAKHYALWADFLRENTPA